MINRKYTGRVLDEYDDNYIIHVEENDLVVSIPYQVMHRYCNFPRSMLTDNGHIRQGSEISLWRARQEAFFPDHAVYSCSNPPSSLVKSRLHQVKGIPKSDISVLPNIAVYSDDVIDKLFKLDMPQEVLIEYLKKVRNSPKEAIRELFYKYGMSPFPKGSETIRYIPTLNLQTISEIAYDLYMDHGGVIIVGASEGFFIFGLENTISSMSDTDLKLRENISKHEGTGILWARVDCEWCQYDCGEGNHHLLLTISVPSKTKY